MSNMVYKGYATKVEYSEPDGCLIGRIIGIKDIVTFHGESVPEFRRAFEEAVDDYLDFCAQAGQAPQKPFSGKIMLRVSPETHARLAIQAQTEGRSINSLAIDALNQVVEGQTG